MPTETTPDFLQLARETVAGAEALRAAERATKGTNLHGWSVSERTPETVEQVAARLERTHAARAAFICSPRGRFCAAVDELETHGCYGEEVYKLRSLYNSRITDLNGPVADPAAVGAAVLILTGIGTKLATAAVEALAELLIQDPAHLSVAA